MQTELTAKQHRAAILVAEDEIPDHAIAANVGVHVVTLERWKKQPAFAAAVRRHIDALQSHLERYSIARKDKRVAAYQQRWEKLHRLIDARGEALADEIAGGETGLIAKEIEVARDGALVENYKTDGPLLSALLSLEKQAAQEAGQWSEKREVSGEVSHTGQVVFVLPQKAAPPDPGEPPRTE